ncbi:MAG: hypothetical protein C5B56_15355 [Proteobacteria bacterium]|nr:MAG: hypothetical protein C5B56_15355 [Pseudomonadota bacterium]
MRAMAEIFFSYKRDDRATVERLVRLLEAENFSVWWDPTIVPGERFASVISQALDAAPCVVVAWSRGSVDSLWVRDEAGVARDRGVLVPVSIDGVEPPLGFRQLHTTNLVDWNGRSDDPRIREIFAGIRRLVVKPLSDDKAHMDRAGKSKAAKPGRRWFVWPAAIVGSAVGAACLAAALLLVPDRRPIPPVEAAPKGGNAQRSFTDCGGGCPEMVVVPTGSFPMGSPDSEPQRGNDEGPAHQVTISKVLAVGRYPITFDEWDFCHQQGGCAGLFPSDHNWGRGRHPVINVSWDDAKAYIAWLSQFTGKTYRLLTEAEREYVARAGTTTPFWWGNSITWKQANYDGTAKYTDEPTGQLRGYTLPVDSFVPNPWGFHQVSGNTWDWVEDCYHDGYEGNAPTNGAAWTTGDCSRRVLRGGSWGSQPRNLRSAARWKLPTDTREPYYGFRVARTCETGCNF